MYTRSTNPKGSQACLEGEAQQVPYWGPRPFGSGSLGSGPKAYRAAASGAELRHFLFCTLTCLGCRPTLAWKSWLVLNYPLGLSHVSTGKLLIILESSSAPMLPSIRTLTKVDLLHSPRLHGG